MNVTKLELFRSKSEFVYRSRSAALKEVRSNGLKSYEYILTDLVENRQYKGGLWLSEKELDILANCETITKGIKYIKYLRKTQK